ncbi:MAG: helix-turn-helix transcriptional regulator [Clostridia bacterium]|nr:helix-turn-helix transcriptional regulator [Clostridia bacterium]
MYQRIRDMREDSDKKQEELAIVLGITRQQYHLYESGKREIPVHHLIKLAKFYNVSVDYLLGLISFPEALNRHGSK